MEHFFLPLILSTGPGSSRPVGWWMVGNAVRLLEMMWFRPCLKGTRAYFDRRWPPAQTEVCNYTGHKHGVLRPGERNEGLWERKTLRSLVQATEALAGRHGNCVTVGG